MTLGSIAGDHPIRSQLPAWKADFFPSWTKISRVGVSFSSVPEAVVRRIAAPWRLARTVPSFREEEVAVSDFVIQEVDRMKELFKRFAQDDSGQDLIEYALLAGFISLVAVAAITTVGTGINTVYGNLNTQVAAIPSP